MPTIWSEQASLWNPSIKLEIQFVIVFSAALPRKIQRAQRIIAFPHFIPLFSFDETSILGKGEVKNKNEAIRGRIAKINVKYIQFSVPKIRKKTDAIITFVTTPQPYKECSLLISLSGLSEGIAATTGLMRTSARPAETENIIVPKTKPK